MRVAAICAVAAGLSAVAVPAAGAATGSARAPTGAGRQLSWRLVDTGTQTHFRGLSVVSRHVAWLADEDGEAAGFVILIPQPGYLLLENVAVRPAAQGRGIGARLLALAEERARGLGLPEIRLYTNEAMTENLAYYPRHGYTQTHRARQDGFDRVFFRKQLGA